MPRRPRRQPLLAAGAALALTLTAYPASASPPGAEDGDQGAATYTNPLMGNFAEAFSDIGLIRGKDGYWYAYATNTVMTRENQESGGDAYLMPISRSADLVDWEFVGETFSEDNHPEWAGWPSRGYWAPDVRYVNGEYLMYYSAPGATDLGAAIGLATAPTPAGPWTDIGEPLVNFVPDSAVMEIDPAVVTATDGTMYLYYGSFRRDGLQVVQLSADGKETVGEPTQVLAGERGEAPWVVHRDGYYYLFYSGYGCCMGAELGGGYPVFAGRSTSPTGPFVDAEGVSLTATHMGGTVVNSFNGNTLAATGHNAIAVDRSGQDWNLVNSDYRFDTWGGRPQAMDRLDWIDGWPTVRAGQWTSDTPQQAPVGSWDVGSTFNDSGLRDWTRVGGGAWGMGEDPDSGGYVHARSAAPHPLLLISETQAAESYRAEADLRVDDRRSGTAGLVVAYQDPDNHVVAWLHPGEQALVVDVTVDGRTSRAGTSPLHDGFSYDTWHSVTAQVRGAEATFEVSASMEGAPLASVTLALPEGLTGPSPVGVASTRGGAHADNVGITELYEPVTEKVPDPEPGELLAEYSDEFDGAGLAEGWTWDGAADAEPAAGELVWETQAGHLGGNNPASVLLREAPEGQYMVETRVTIPLDDADQRERAGLVAMVTRDESLHVAPVPTGATRQAFLWPGSDNSPWPEAIQLGPSADTLWLRLHHTIHPETGEHLYQAATSHDGETWQWGSYWYLSGDAEPPRIGLVSMGGEGATATFDYFRVYSG